MDRKVIKYAIAIMVLSVCFGTSHAMGQNDSIRHNIRVGWGDMIFESVAFAPSMKGVWANPSALPSDYTRFETFDHRYTGHIFAEYQYRLTRVVSIGGLADAEGIFWTEGTFDRYHNLVGKATDIYNWDVVLMATARFTYMNRPCVRLYSGVGLGVLFAFDNQGGFEAAPSLSLNWIGVEVGRGHWGGAAELGMLNSLLNARQIYQLGSRLISVSVFYRW